MSSIKGRNTKPELTVRRLLYHNGFKGYRIHCKEIPGRPDIVFKKKKLAIFINGCFWHRCPKCNLPLPKSNTDFWKNKLDKNICRDNKKINDLREIGWNTLTLWECEINNDLDVVLKKIVSYI